MHITFLLLIAAGVVLYFWYQSAPNPAQRQFRKKALFYGALGLLALGFATGRVHPATAGAGGLLLTLFRVWNLFSVARQFHRFKQMFDQMRNATSAPSPGQASNVETRFVRIRLYHDTGEMSGEVLAGRHAGCELGGLSLIELMELHGEYVKADPESAAVLEAFLERYHEDWREHAAPSSSSDLSQPSTGMTLHEARDILGIDNQATKDDIVQAHRRLMQRMHPDRGGSNYLATKINQAKELLLEAARNAA